jgi:hypothetical protein
MVMLKKNNADSFRAIRQQLIGLENELICWGKLCRGVRERNLDFFFLLK